MKNSYLYLFILSLIGFSCVAQKPSLSKRLGYTEKEKLLIIHADDLGVSHSENRASIAAFEKGIVNSGSIMVPCPWFPEIAAYSVEHPAADLGLHLTLTAEWKTYKWGPVSPIAEVPGLVNKKGFLYDNCSDVVLNASAAEVEKELRAQIERALSFGVNVSHLDSHMGCLFNPKYFETYLKVGRAYQLPVLLPISGLQQFPGLAEKIQPSDILIEDIFMIYPPDAEKGMEAYYEKVLRNLPDGVSQILIHVAFDDAEMQAITEDHPDYGAAWRQVDYDFFTSEACRRIIQEEGIRMVTWREIGKLVEGK